MNKDKDKDNHQKESRVRIAAEFKQIVDQFNLVDLLLRHSCARSSGEDFACISTAPLKKYVVGRRIVWYVVSQKQHSYQKRFPRA